MSSKSIRAKLCNVGGVLFRKRRCRAFQVLEMVLAAMIFATVAVGFLGIFTSHAKSIHRARIQLMAQHLAKEKMADFLAAGYEGVDQLITHNAAPYPLASNPVSLTIRIKDIDHVVDFEVWVANLDTTTIGVLGEKTIWVGVYWAKDNGYSSVELRTVLSEHG